MTNTTKRLAGLTLAACAATAIAAAPGATQDAAAPTTTAWPVATTADLPPGVVQPVEPGPAEQGATTTQAGVNVISGGDLMQVPSTSTAAGAICTAGIEARSGAGIWYLVMPGHCVRAQYGASWSTYDRAANTLGPIIGKGVRWSEGSGAGTDKDGRDDGAIVINAGLPQGPQVKSACCTYHVTGQRDAVVGEQVCMVGANHTPKVTFCGTVPAGGTGASVTYTTGEVIHQMTVVTKAGACPISGDSGSPALVGTTAVGFLTATASAGGTCYMYVQSIREVLAFFKLDV